MRIAGQWQKNEAYIRSLLRFRPSRRRAGRTHRCNCRGTRLSIRQRRSLESIEQELVANDLSLPGMFAEFGGLPTRPRWVTGGPRAPWEHPQAWS
jgi:hypothetical protein